jgi:hypothetical protein
VEEPGHGGIEKTRQVGHGDEFTDYLLPREVSGRPRLSRSGHIDRGIGLQEYQRIAPVKVTAFFHG